MSMTLLILSCHIKKWFFAENLLKITETFLLFVSLVIQTDVKLVITNAVHLESLNKSKFMPLFWPNGKSLQIKIHVLS